MTATSHLVTGAVVAAVIPNPVVAVLAALGAHIVLDMLPHFGMRDHTSAKFLYYLAADAGLGLSFLLSIAVLQPADWQIIIAGAVACAVPDLLWMPDFIKELLGRPVTQNRLNKWMSDIQKYESPKGIFFELPWLIAMVLLFGRLAF